jgi:hypothetical protein
MAVAYTSDNFTRASAGLDLHGSTADLFDGGTAAVWDTGAAGYWHTVLYSPGGETEARRTADAGYSIGRAVLPVTPYDYRVTALLWYTYTGGSGWRGAVTARNNAAGWYGLVWEMLNPLRIVRFDWDGAYSVTRTTLWERTWSVGQGTTLGIEARGSLLIASVDGVDIGGVSDETFATGDPGIYASTAGGSYVRWSAVRVDTVGAGETGAAGTAAVVTSTATAAAGATSGAANGAVTTASAATGGLAVTGSATSTVTVTSATGPGVSTTLEVAMAGVDHASMVYGPRLSGSAIGPVVPLAVTLHDPNDLLTPVASLDAGWSRQWREELSEPGNASLTVASDDPAVAELQPGRVMRFAVDGNVAFAAIVRERSVALLDQGEEAAQVIKLSGPGTLAVLDTAVVYPTRGLASRPVADDRHWGWFAPGYDATAWPLVNVIKPLVDAQAEGGWLLPFAEGFPAVPGIDVIWGPGDDQDAAEGHCYFRREFFTAAGDMTIYAAADNRGEIYLDGALIANVETFGRATVTEPIAISSGWHTLAAHVWNGPDDGYAGGNPGGFVAAGWLTDAGGNLRQYAFTTESSWQVLAYPPTEPAITVGQVLSDAIDEAVTRGCLPTAFTATFTATHDSGGNPWPAVTTISTRVGTDLLTFFRELAGTYVDLWMSPAEWRLSAWRRDERGTDRPVSLHGPTDPTDPTSGNLTVLSYRGTS